MTNVDDLTNDDEDEIDAEEIFLFMHRDFRVSRNVRAHWYFEHLNETVRIETERFAIDRQYSPPV
jgi:hypothetical protein